MTDILTTIADLYRTRGPLAHEVPARSFLSLMPRAVLEAELGRLLDEGALVAASQGSVGLAPSLRVSLLGRTVLEGWLVTARRNPAAADVLLTAVRAELRVLVRHCLGAPEGSPLVVRGVRLAAVRAMRDLDVRAIDVVGGLVAPPHVVLREVAALPEGGCLSLGQLQARTRALAGNPVAA